MWQRRMFGAAFLVAVLSLCWVPISGQGSISDQVLRLLDRENTWTKTQTMAANYGWQFNDGAPSVVTNRLYNQAGVLYWNGFAIATGGGITSYWKLIGGTTIVPDPITYKVRLGSSGTTSNVLYVDGTSTTTGAAIFSSTVGTGALTALSLGVTNGATVGGSLGVTGGATFSSTVGTGALTAASLGVTAGATVGTTLGVTGAATFSNTVGVTGVLTASSGAILGTNTGTTAGTIRWNGSNFQGYNGAGWVSFDAGTVTAGGWTEDAPNSTVYLATPAQSVSINGGSPASAKLHVVSTTQQLRLGYDGSNYLSTTVSSAGLATIDAVGAGSAFAFQDGVTINSNLDIRKTTRQLQLAYDGSNYVDFTVSSAGLLTLDAVDSGGSTAAFAFQDPVTFNGNVDIVSSSTAQVKAQYDAGNYMTLTVGSTGIASFAATSGTAVDAFVFSDPVTVNSNLEVYKSTTQFRASYDTTHYMTLTVGSDAKATFGTVHGAGVGEFAFQNPTTFGAAAVGEIRLTEPSGTGTDYVGFKAPTSIASSLVYELPAADGSAGDQLTTSGAGVLSWTASGAGAMSNPMTTKGDIIIAADTASPSTPARLGLGTVGQCLVSDAGTSNLPKWGSCAAAASAAGSDTQVQYNNAGAFGANAAFAWSAPTLSLSGSTTGKRLNLQLRNTGTGSSDTDFLQIGNDTLATALSVSVTSSAHATPNSAFIYNMTTGVAAGTLSLGAAATELLRLARTTETNIKTIYDGSNYMALSVSSTGAVAFDAVGTAPGINLADTTTVQTTSWVMGDAPADTWASTCALAGTGTGKCSEGITTRGTAKYIAGLPAVGKGSFLASLPMGNYTDLYPGGVANVTGFATVRTHPAKRQTVNASGNDYKEGYTHFLIDSPQVTARILDGMYDGSTGGIYQRNFLFPDFWYDASSRYLRIYSMFLSAINDPVDLSMGRGPGVYPHEPNISGNTRYETSGYLSFRAWVPNNGFGAQYADVRGRQGGTDTTGLLLLSTKTGATGTTRQMRTTEDIANFPAGYGPYGYGADESIPHVALHPSGQLEVGYETDPTKLPAALLLVRGPLSVDMPTTVAAGTYAGSFYNENVSTTAHGLFVRLDQNTATNIFFKLQAGAGTILNQVNGSGDEYLLGTSQLMGAVGIGMAPDPTNNKLSVSANVDGYAQYLYNGGNASNRKGMRINAGQNSPAGTTIWFLRFDDGDGDQVGEITYAGGVMALTTVSDQALKENIVDAGPMIETVKKMKVRDFNFKDNPGKVLHGFVAQELEAVYPDSVHIMDSGLKGVDNASLVPLLVQSVQYLSDKVDSLESRIEKLEKRK